MNYEKDFNKYIYWLGYSIPEDMQKEAIEFLVKCKDEDIRHIICIDNAYTWGNAIEVLKRIGYPRNKTAVLNIMYLFQDINWTFIEDAFEIVKHIYVEEPNEVITALEKTTEIADYHHDNEWLFGLSWLKERLGISKSDFVKKSTIDLLYKSEFWENQDDII